MNIIFFGAPGAGKGTQAEIVSKQLEIPTISTGAMLREAVKNATEAGLNAKSFMDSGALVPDSAVIAILKDRIAAEDCKKGFILDGFPRTVPQAEALESMGIKIDRVIEIAVPFDVIKERLTGRRVCEKCGANYHTAAKPSKDGEQCEVCGEHLTIRSDDQPDVVNKRLATYGESTAPLKGYYENLGKLVTVDGTKGIDATTAQILTCLENA